MLPDTVRLPQPTKEQLLRLKRSTGIKQWNILCRWAFCTSITDSRHLPVADNTPMSNVEMSWKVFGGTHAHTYAALLVHDRASRRVPATDLSLLLQAHLRRGVGALLLAPPTVAGLVSPAGHQMTGAVDNLLRPPKVV